MYICTCIYGNWRKFKRKRKKNLVFPRIHKKKEKGKNEEGRKKGYREVLQFQMQFLGRPPSTGHSTYRALETTRRHRKTVCADSWSDFSLADTLLFRITGIKRVGKWRRYKRSGVQLDSGDSFDQLEERRRRTASLLK